MELLNLVGCMDPKATNYKTYYEKDDRRLPVLTRPGPGRTPWSTAGSDART